MPGDERATRARLILEHQLAHLLCLIGLLAGLLALARLPGFRDGELLGIGTTTWIVLAVLDAVLHQVFVWFCWRAELHGGLLTRVLGGSAFVWYALVFTILIALRPVLVTALAISNAGTLLSTPWVMTTIAMIAAIPGIYLMYSIARYFGFKRAYGADHFDPAYRSIPLVRQGIFRFSGNAMYDFGLLMLWIPGLLCQSLAALAVALFSHLYIWVHYYCTEKPDMDRIYR